jgi:TatD DNase family protein
MFDSHCHLDAQDFDPDRAQVLEAARAAGVTDILVPAVRPGGWAAMLALRARHAGCGVRLHLALGIHPQIVPALAEAEHRALDGLSAALGEAGAVAVGECGLDGGTADHAAQERIFRAQIAVARELRLPLVVHVLRAHDSALRVMREAQAHEVGGIMHSYSGGAALVPVYRDLGFAFSLAGPVTYEKARRPLESARAIPAELLLAETDAPDQAPAPHRGGRCAPAHLVEVVAALAAARGESVEGMAALTAANARRVLRGTT